jgi:hypothetical protein
MLEDFRLQQAERKLLIDLNPQRTGKNREGT